MAGRGTISVNQSKAYGDTQLLDAAKTMTETPLTGMPVPARGAGRPPNGRPSQQAQQGGPSAQEVPSAQQQQMQEFVAITKAKQYWDRMLQLYPSSWTREKALDADEEYQRAAHALRGGTPFFSGV